MRRRSLTMAVVLLAGPLWAAAPPVRDVQRQRQLEEARKRTQEGIRLYQQGQRAQAAAIMLKVLQTREALYPPGRFPQGHQELAETLTNLGALLQGAGEYDRAEGYYRRALKMYEALLPPARFPDGHPDLAMCLNNLGTLLQAQGEYAAAEEFFLRTLKMYEGLLPPKRFPRGHPSIAMCLNNLGFLLHAQGEYARAEQTYRRAVKMYEALYPADRYPQGHADLASGLNNLGLLLKETGQLERAKPYFERALKMTESLFPRARFPQGHPDLAGSLNNLGLLLEAQGDYDKAEDYFRRALKMYEDLFPAERYPQGHPYLASGLINRGSLLRARGEYDKAEKYSRRAVKMLEDLFPAERYPQGHPRLGNALSNLGGVLHAKGEDAKAEPYLLRSLKMSHDLAGRRAASAPEAQALNYLVTLPLSRDAYLSVTRHLSGVDAYPAVWQSRALISRVCERRHLAVLASAGKARALWDNLLGLRRRREALLLAPAGKGDLRRDRALEALDADIAAGERALRPLLPELKRSQELTRATPADLQKRLPAGSVLIDLLRYIRFEQDPRRPGAEGVKRTPCYVGFILGKDRLARVELGPAAPIEEALRQWRQAIAESRPGEADAGRRHAEQLRRLVWLPLRGQLPAGTATVYLAPDMGLTRLPWAALPGQDRGRVLLEEHALLIVPHGPFLLDRLTAAAEEAGSRPTLLTLGAVRYDRSPDGKAYPPTGLRSAATKGKLLWSYLPGTETELQRLGGLARGLRLRSWQGEQAGVARLLAELPQAHYAHLATHGFFADASFRSVLQLDEKLFTTKVSPEGYSLLRLGAGARSPLVLSGLVCAGANLPDTPQRGILTGDAIVGLDLRKLRLAVLSACETGLGEVGGGEGVYGLTRAFHVAGTRNVVASLWKVDDQATAALMTLFYRNLWHSGKKVTPAEALRQAQLALYRNPQHVKEWAQGRGPNLKTVLSGSGAKGDGQEVKTAPAKAWAAFVLSGPGD